MSKINGKKITRSLLAAGLLMVSLLCMSGCAADKEVQDLYGVELEALEQSDISSEQNVLANYKTKQAENGEYVRQALANVSIYYPVTADLVCEKENAFVREVCIKGKQEQMVKKGEVLISFEVETDPVEMEKCTLKLQRCLEAMEKGKAERQEAILEAETAAAALGGRELELALLKIEKLQTEYEEFVYMSEYEVAKYQEQLALLKSEKEGYDLIAPFDGIIDYMEIMKPGEKAEKGQILITMYDPEQYYLAAEDVAGNLRYNQNVTVTAGPADDKKTYTGKVVSAYNVLLPAVPKGDPLIRLEEDVEAGKLEIAAHYEADIERLQNVLLIDKSVIRMDEDKSYVRILEDDMIQKRYILPGLRNSETVWVLDGLSGDQKVIAE